MRNRSSAPALPSASRRGPRMSRSAAGGRAPCPWGVAAMPVFRARTVRLPVAIVAGLHADARRAAVEELLRTVPGSVALHHDLTSAVDNAVHRTVRDADRDSRDSRTDSRGISTVGPLDVTRARRSGQRFSYGSDGSSTCLTVFASSTGGRAAEEPSLPLGCQVPVTGSTAGRSRLSAHDCACNGAGPDTVSPTECGHRCSDVRTRRRRRGRRTSRPIAPSAWRPGPRSRSCVSTPVMATFGVRRHRLGTGEFSQGSRASLPTVDLASSSVSAFGPSASS